MVREYQYWAPTSISEVQLYPGNSLGTKSGEPVKILTTHPLFLRKT